MTIVYLFLKRYFGILTSLYSYLRYNSHSFHLINLIFNKHLEYIWTHIFVQNMGLSRHHMAISQLKY